MKSGVKSGMTKSERRNGSREQGDVKKEEEEAGFNYCLV